MRYYLIDTSAFVYAIENLDKIKMNFFTEKANGTAFLYMAQFCVPEVFNTFARFFYRDKKIGDRLYNKWRNQFIRAIHNRRILYCYDLHRYHNLNTKTIYKIEHKVPYKDKENALSTFDILVIAMGIELKKIHCSNEVLILTRDRRLCRISKMSKEFAPALWFE
jgi:hypothetical protein